jgi:hypothetical protein
VNGFLAECLIQPVETGLTILFAEEAGLTIASQLDYVERLAIETDAGWSEPQETPAEKYSSPPSASFLHFLSRRSA